MYEVEEAEEIKTKVTEREKEAERAEWEVEGKKSKVESQERRADTGKGWSIFLLLFKA